MDKKYVLDRKRLERGDIILTAEPTKQSRGIRLVTASRYSHAAIWVGGTMIEATLDGVFSKNAQRLLVDEPNYLAVYRSKMPLSTEMQDKICLYAQSKIGTLYTIPEATMMLPMRLLKMPETRRQFCSRLVACAYDSAGFDLKNLRNPAFCSPRQLSLCKAFHKVEGVVVEATPEDIFFAHTPDPNIEHLSQTYQWLNNVRRLVGENPKLSMSFDIQAKNDVDALLIAHPELDIPVTTFMRNTGYLKFFERERVVNPHRYDRIAMIERICKISNPGDFLQEELSKEPGLFKRFANNIDVMIQYVDQQRLEFFIEHLRLYRNLMEEVQVRMEVIAFGFESIGESGTALEVKELIALAKYLVKMADDKIQS